MLVEPILDMPPFPPEKVEATVKGVEQPPTEEEVSRMNPTWSREECVLRRMGVLQLDKRVVADLFDVCVLLALSLPPFLPVPSFLLLSTCPVALPGRVPPIVYAEVTPALSGE